MNASSQLVLLARKAASAQSLDPALVCAIVEQESAWDPNAIRYEPAFRQRYVARLGLAPTEEIARSISWGLMQVMGQVAREHNFAAKSLASLCDPATSLEVGCTVFAAKLRAVGGDAGMGEKDDAASVANNVIARALQLWNGGANPAYAAQVLARIANYQ